EDLFPELHAPGNVGICGQAVPVRMITVREHRDDGSAADAIRIVESGLRESVGLQLRDARVAHRHHVILRSKLETPGRTGLDAGWLESHIHAVDTERALGHLAGRLVKARPVERAAGLAVAAADA